VIGMRKLLLVVFPAGLLLLAGIMVVSALRAKGEAGDARAERLRLKREFDERSALARALPAEGAQAWRDEAGALLRSYFQAMAEVHNRFPHVPAPPSALAAAEAERKGSLPEKDRAVIEDFQKYADARLALLQGGGYAPVGAAVAGGLRLDVLAVEPGASPAGGPGLRVDFALWGAPRLLERERTGARTVSRTVVPVSMKGLQFRFLDAAGKDYGEMNGPGEPYQKLTDPERFAPDFPPGILFGTWWVELLPREAATVDVRLDLEVRGSSGSARPVALGLRLPVQEGWRIPPGATYQAEVRVVPPSAGK
jgi:hypothetical protein